MMQKSNSRAELVAFKRVKARRHNIQRVELTDEAANRMLRDVSPAARRLVWSMIAYLAMHETKVADLADAADTLGVKEANWRIIDELHEAGLMVSKPNGFVVMHSFFTGLGHAVRRHCEPTCKGDGDGNSGSAVIAFGAQAI